MTDEQYSQCVDSAPKVHRLDSTLSIQELRNEDDKLINSEPPLNAQNDARASKSTVKRKTKRKPDRSAAKKERKATKTLAIVLGEFS